VEKHSKDKENLKRKVRGKRVSYNHLCKIKDLLSSLLGYKISSMSVQFSLSWNGLNVLKVDDSDRTISSVTLVVGDVVKAVFPVVKLVGQRIIHQLSVQEASRLSIRVRYLAPPADEGFTHVQADGEKVETVEVPYEAALYNFPKGFSSGDHYEVTLSAEDRNANAFFKKEGEREEEWVVEEGFAVRYPHEEREFDLDAIVVGLFGRIGELLGI
jgi:hypothetical protein